MATARTLYRARAFILTGPTSSSVDLYAGARWTDEFRERSLRRCQQWQRRHGRDNRGIYLGDYRLSQCSNGLCLRYCSIGQRDLQRHDSCIPRRNTGHLRMDVGNRSEPELHASDPCTAAAASNWASGRHHQSRNLDRKLFSQH